MNRVLDYVFLRLFALTLARRYRNSADNACSDAIMLTGVVLTIPLIFLWAAFAVAIPSVVKPKPSIGAALLIVAPMMYFVNHRLRSYRMNPQAAARYSDRGQRLGTLVMLIGLLMGAPVVIGLLLAILTR